MSFKVSVLCFAHVWQLCALCCITHCVKASFCCCVADLVGVLVAAVALVAITALTALCCVLVALVGVAVFLVVFVGAVTTLERRSKSPNRNVPSHL
jgi:hypothetical protein